MDGVLYPGKSMSVMAIVNCGRHVFAFSLKGTKGKQ
jgi:hypothetical protein